MTTTSRRLARLCGALALAASPLALALTSAPAHAAVACGVVSDQADVLDDNAVADAAAGLAGADVHVVAFDSVPNADIDKAVLDMRAECDNWQSNAGGWGRNDLVLAVSVKDRKSALYYGPQFESNLGGNRYRGALDGMGPYFADGDFTTGIEAGLDGVEGLLDGTTTVPNNTTRTVTSTPSEPIDVPWGGIFGTMGGLALLGGGAFGGVKARRYLLDRNAARGEANRITDEASSVFVELDTLAELTKSRVELLPQVDDDGINAIRDGHAKATEVATAADAAWMAHSEQWTTTAIGDANLADAKAAQASAEAVFVQLKAALRALQGVDSELTTLEERNAQTPKVLDASEAILPQVIDVFDSLDADGYFTTAYRDTVAKVVERISEARGWHAESLWGEAADAASEISADLTAVHEAGKGLRQRRQAIDEGIAALYARHASMASSGVGADSTLAELTGGYHSECVEGLAERVEAGKHAYDDALATIKQAEAEASMDTQQFADAEHISAQATALLDTARDDFAAPAVQSVKLAKLTERLPKDVATVRSSIRDLDAAMSQHADAVKFLDRKPATRKHASTVDSIDSELAAQRPRLATLSRAIDDAAQAVQADRDRVETIAREYADAQAKIQRARSAVRDAESQSSRMHAGAHSKSLASQAATELRQAERFTSIAEAARYAASAISTAQSAEQAARSAINAHEAEERRRQQAAAAAAAAASSSYSSSSSSSYSSGGSSDWGGGGGSSSFDGGGGSSSW